MFGKAMHKIYETQAGIVKLAKESTACFFPNQLGKKSVWVFKPNAIMCIEIV